MKINEIMEAMKGEGVVWRKLGEVATDFYRGNGIKKTDLTESGTPCVRYADIYTKYNIYFDKCECYTDASKIANKKWAEKGDILFAITGESVEDIGKSVAYLGDEPCLVGGDIAVMKHNLGPKYLSFALMTFDALKQKRFGKTKNKVVHTSVPSLKEITIPVPSLCVQLGIGGFLDRYEELERELDGRRKEKEYWRERIFEGLRGKG